MQAKSIWLLALLAGCPDRTISALPPVQDKIEVKDIPAVPRRDVDILFVVDDSGSMVDEQASLRTNFERFIAVLESLDGGLPDVHIGVITPNLGTSALDGTTAPPTGTCVDRGEAGALRALTDGPAYLSDVDDGSGGRTRNYSGTLTEAFSQIANVGAAGCGIEQHLEAMKRALDGSQPQNAGFVRPGAYLAVVIVADEDDCSLAKSTIFDAPRDASYGDIVNFRCTSEGVSCDVGNPDLNVPGAREDCHPDEASTTIAGVDRYIEFLRTLKADPRDVVVAGILGTPTPFATTGEKGPTTLSPSCRYDGQFAFPAVRTAAFLEGFEHATLAPICAGDLSGSLTQIGALVKEVINDPCFDHPLLDADPEVPGPQYDCSIVEFRRIPDGPDQDLRVLPPCDASGAVPCWRIVEDPVKCAYTATDPHLKLVIDRGTELPAPDIRVRASCVTTDAPAPVM